MTDPVALLSEYLRIDTSNPPGDCRGAAELLCGALRAEGLSPVTFGAKPEKPNVLCHVGGTEEPGLVLIHHMDVVPAKAEEWTVPPFSAQVRDGFLYGRGTLDTKGLGAAHWCAALRAAKAGILRRKLFLVANADEEVGGGEGAEYFVRNLPFPNRPGVRDERGRRRRDRTSSAAARKILPPQHVGEGTRVDEALRRRGGRGTAVARRPRTPRRGWPGRWRGWRNSVSRRRRAGAGHAAGAAREGTLDLDVDALRGGANEVEALEALGRRFPEIDPLLRNTFAVTTLSAGFKPNVIPSSAEGTIDGRIVPGEEPEAVAARVRALVADLDVSVGILFAEKPNGSPMGPLYGAMEAAVLAVHPDAVVVPYMSTGFTDSRFFRSIGIPTYGLMPVLLPRAEHGKIHGVDERIPVDGIEEMTRIVYALIEGWNA